MTKAAFQTFDAPPAASATGERVARVRAAMAQAGLDALLVPRADEYQGEYVPASAERLAWITGFTGSAGLAVVARKKAAVFVDGRYTVQAPREVDTTVFAVEGIRSTALRPWLLANVPNEAVIGFDPRLHTVTEIEALKEQLAEHGATLKATSRNLVDRVWGVERPPAPGGVIDLQSIDYAGRTGAEKLADLQRVLKEARQDAVVLSAPDSVCWLFNIRGHDVAHNPVVLAYAIVPQSGKAELFIDPARVGGEGRAHLGRGVKIRKPEEFVTALGELKAAGKITRIAPAGTSWWCYRALGGAKTTRRGVDPCSEPKAIKNEAEIAGARAAHVRDGVAVTRFLAWLDGAAAEGTLDEITAVQQLEAMRRDTGLLREISFPTISGSGPNGAIVHYRVTRATNRTLGLGELFLIDSGGQYADGTTDITRTVAIGKPSAEMRDRFTRVLQGMIAISMARFPKGTRGVDIDAFARRALWAAGFNYDHGTGHGVGSYLSVHEGPQSISKAGMYELKPGMICSNEPGYYKAGTYGIRIENLVLVMPPQDQPGGEMAMLGFETLTLAPIDQRLIDVGLLSQSERDWLNAYHARMVRELSPHLDTSTKRWLKAATEKI
jgi:Xaa-Pro aminopeptidase